MTARDGYPVAVRPLHGLRVLLVGRDSSFGKVASALLARRGHVTDFTTDPGAAFAAISRLGPNIVVIDGSGWLPAAADAATALESAAPSAGILLVSDSPQFGVAGHRRVVPKWTSFAGLVAEVEGARREPVALRPARPTLVAAAG
jgi:hypothetical protein